MIHQADTSIWAHILRIAQDAGLNMVTPGITRKGKPAQCFWFPTPEAASTFIQEAHALNLHNISFLFRPTPCIVAVRFPETPIECMAYQAINHIAN